jgi:hypothetical protein
MLLHVRHTPQFCRRVTAARRHFPKTPAGTLADLTCRGKDGFRTRTRAEPVPRVSGRKLVEK